MNMSSGTPHHYALFLWPFPLPHSLYTYGSVFCHMLDVVIIVNSWFL